MAPFSTLNDAELLSLLRENSELAFAEIYQRYFRALYAYAYKKLRDSEKAKDVIQEFFTTLWLKRTELQISQSVTGYFYTAVNRRIIDCFLRQDVEAKYIEAFVNRRVFNHVETDHRIREKQLTALIEKEIQSLPPRMREAFELSRKQHLSHKEIAEQMGITESTVDRQISNALSILKTRLGLVAWIIFLIRY